MTDKKEIPKVEGQWELKLWVDCPHCGEFLSFMEIDDNWEYFTRLNIEKHRNLDIESRCPKCEGEFILDEVDF